MNLSIETDNCIINKKVREIVYNPQNNTLFIKGIEISNGEFDADAEINVEYKDEISVNIRNVHQLKIED